MGEERICRGLIGFAYSPKEPKRAQKDLRSRIGGSLFAINFVAFNSGCYSLIGILFLHFDTPQRLLLIDAKCLKTNKFSVTKLSGLILETNLLLGGRVKKNLFLNYFKYFLVLFKKNCFNKFT